jgi:hypothetical protein
MSVVFSTNKTDHHDIAEILFKVVLSNITLTMTQIKVHVYPQIYLMITFACHSDWLIHNIPVDLYMYIIWFVFFSVTDRPDLGKWNNSCFEDTMG